MGKLEPQIILSLASLKPADIILTTTDHYESLSIRLATGGPVSHSMLFLGSAGGASATVAEAVGSGSREAPIGTALVGATVAIVLRRREITAAQASEVVSRARTLIMPSRPYDTLGAVGAGMTVGNCVAVGVVICAPLYGSVLLNSRPSRRDLRFFCSELVARAFQMAGVPIIDEEPSFANPYEVLQSKHLRYAGNLQVRAS